MFKLLLLIGQKSSDIASLIFRSVGRKGCVKLDTGVLSLLLSAASFILGDNFMTIFMKLLIKMKWPISDLNELIKKESIKMD